MGTQFNGTQNINQFNQGPVQGDLDTSVGSGDTVSCQVDSTSAGGLVAGQPVKLIDSGGGVPKVVEAAVDTDDIYGFIKRSIKKTTFEVGDPVEIALFRGPVMYMTASGAIARGAKVMVVIATKKVATHGGAGQRVVGRAFDKAAADGDLIRVFIDLPGATA